VQNSRNRSRDVNGEVQRTDAGADDGNTWRAKSRRFIKSIEPAKKCGGSLLLAIKREEQGNVWIVAEAFLGGFPAFAKLSCGDSCSFAPQKFMVA
jgi:hypothetical protein